MSTKMNMNELRKIILILLVISMSNQAISQEAIVEIVNDNVLQNQLLEMMNEQTKVPNANKEMKNTTKNETVKTEPIKTDSATQQQDMKKIENTLQNSQATQQLNPPNITIDKNLQMNPTNKTTATNPVIPGDSLDDLIMLMPKLEIEQPEKKTKTPEEQKANISNPILPSIEKKTDPIVTMNPQFKSEVEKKTKLDPEGNVKDVTKNEELKIKKSIENKTIDNTEKNLNDQIGNNLDKTLANTKESIKILQTEKQTSKPQTEKQILKREEKIADEVIKESEVTKQKVLIKKETIPQIDDLEVKLKSNDYSEIKEEVKAQESKKPQIIKESRTSQETTTKKKSSIFSRKSSQNQKKKEESNEKKSNSEDTLVEKIESIMTGRKKNSNIVTVDDLRTINKKAVEIKEDDNTFLIENKQTDINSIQEIENEVGKSWDEKNVDSIYENKVFEYNERITNLNNYKILREVPEFLKKAEDTIGNNHLKKIYYYDDYIKTLFHAIEDQNTGAIDRLFRIIKNIEIKNHKGDTPLIHAVKQRKLHSIKYLIKRGCDKNYQNDSGETPKNIAISNKDYKILLILNEN